MEAVNWYDIAHHGALAIIVYLAIRADLKWISMSVRDHEKRLRTLEKVHG